MERKKVIKDTYDFLQKKRGKIKKRALFFAGFLFCIDVYAWFVFNANVNGNITADVVSWSVNFYENNVEIRDFDVVVDNMKPGMATNTTTIIIRNTSSVEATFSYDIDEMTLFGVEYNIDGVTLTSNDVLDKLGTKFPFTTIFSASKTDLSSEDDASIFTATVNWPFESTNAYYKLTNDYIYTPYINYYTYSNSTYTLDPEITDENFDSNVTSGLYVQSDDADSYWGEKCSEYKIANPTSSCLILHMNLTVTQKGA